MNPPGTPPRRQIDWEEVHAKLDRASAAQRGVRLSPEQSRAILDERARALARVPAEALDAADVVELALFSLGDERYAIETRYVRRIVRLGAVTPVPGAPEALLGVTNSGGEILAVFDLRTLFAGPRAEAGDRSRLVVLGADREEFGVVADAAHEVLTLKLDAVLPPPSTIEGHGRHLLRGITEDALIVLDGDMLLRDERLFINQNEDGGG